MGVRAGCAWERGGGVSARTAPQDRREPVRHLGVAGRAELRLDEVILAERVAQKHLLALVRHGDDGGGQQPRQPDREEESLQGEEGEVDGVVGGEARGLAPLLVLQRVLPRVEAPVEEEDREGQRPVPVLVLAQRRVVLRVRHVLVVSSSRRSTLSMLTIPYSLTILRFLSLGIIS